jgi:hypothetical protein
MKIQRRKFVLDSITGHKIEVIKKEMKIGQASRNTVKLDFGSFHLVQRFTMD